MSLDTRQPALWNEAPESEPKCIECEEVAVIDDCDRCASCEAQRELMPEDDGPEAA